MLCNMSIAMYGDDSDNKFWPANQFTLYMVIEELREGEMDQSC